MARFDELARIVAQANFKLIASGSAFGILFMIELLLCLLAGPWAEPKALNLACLVAGTAVGWVVGTGLSPYSEDEETKFTAYGRAIGLFASGYLLAKADRLVDALLSPDLLLEAAQGFRVLITLSALLQAVVITFIFRRYAGFSD